MFLNQCISEVDNLRNICMSQKPASGKELIENIRIFKIFGTHNSSPNV